jgi:cellulose synthase/poly-beta-1,6-N-acetylglucosamine synthase-like glycosyltransferase
MTMLALLSIALVVLVLYVVAVVLLTIGMGRLPTCHTPVNSSHRPVTLIIPFRNEKDHLPQVVQDLKGQSHPGELTQVIFVNDHSTDGGGNLLRELVETCSQCTVLDLPDGRSGKKEALACGVEHAGNDWIIQTDADCRFGPGFITSHMAFHLNDPYDLVAGMVTVRGGRGKVIEILERLDLLSLVGAGSGSFSLGRPIMCSGANLAYSRQLFLETRPFDPSPRIASGDDMFLMIGARKLKRRMGYLMDREAMVETAPAGSLPSLIRQRIRWGSKTPHLHMPDIQGMALVTMLANLLILALPWIMVLEPDTWRWAVPAFLAKTLADFWMLFRITGYTGQRSDLRMFPLILPLYYPYQGIVLLGSLFGKVSWKGRG